MDFKDQEVDFQEADRRYAELKQQREAGILSDAEFAAQYQRLMVLDDEGRWWAKSRETGEWRYHDGNAWIPGTPPSYQDDTPETPGEPTTESTTETSTEAASSSAQTTSSLEQASTPPPSKVSVTGRQRMPLWIPIAGLGGLALIGLVLFFWVLLPTVLGSPSSNEQGGQGSGQAQDGIVFDAVFTHRANPSNITDNSTYIDNPLTNEDPNVILQVTQNWNPKGGPGTYNNHPIGVWYDSDRERWAIFNQDRAAMPDGADFNVSVLKQPKEE